MPDFFGRWKTRRFLEENIHISTKCGGFCKGQVCGGMPPAALSVFGPVGPNPAPPEGEPRGLGNSRRWFVGAIHESPAPEGYLTTLGAPSRWALLCTAGQEISGSPTKDQTAQPSRSPQTRERESKGREPLFLWCSFPHFSGEMGPPPGRQIFNCSDRLRSTGYPSQFPPSPGRICRAFRSGRWSAGRWCGPGSGTPCRFPSGRAWSCSG